MRFNVRSPSDVVADVSTWPARLEAFIAGAHRTELEYLAGEVALFGQALEAVERAVLRRRRERQEAESKALKLALRGQAGRDSKGPGRQPGALIQHSHTGPYPVGDHYAPPS